MQERVIFVYIGFCLNVTLFNDREDLKNMSIFDLGFIKFREAQNIACVIFFIISKYILQLLETEGTCKNIEITHILEEVFVYVKFI